jgi:hypothetical protein
MGLFQRLTQEWPPRPRPATDDDRAGWFSAATEADKPPALNTREQLITHLRHKNPVRVHRLRKDFKWMQKEMKKLGRNPEDARWLL